MWRENVFLFFTLIFVSCEQRNGESEETTRGPRLFTFNTNNDDVKIELTFTIPFVSIPAKPAYDTVYGIISGDGPLININPATIAVGGAILIGSTLLLPLVVKSLSHEYRNERYSRLLDMPRFSTDAFLELASHTLADSKAVHGCTLRIACWSGQRSQSDNTWRRITSNSLVSTMINSTAVEEAILWGRKGRDCTSYNPCPLTEDHIPMILGNLALFTHSLGW